MFERYTESARRALFFARYEVSQLGAVSIEAEHLLLGVMREAKGIVGRILSEAHVSPDEVRRDVEGRSLFHEKVSTSVEIPFAESARRVLNFAAEEADQLKHGYIGTEHLLLGLLRDKESPAAAILEARGLHLDATRSAVLRIAGEPSEGSGLVTDVVTEIDQLKEMVDQLATLPPGGERSAVAQQIRNRLDALKRYFGR